MIYMIQILTFYNCRKGLTTMKLAAISTIVISHEIGNTILQGYLFGNEEPQPLNACDTEIYGIFNMISNFFVVKWS